MLTEIKVEAYKSRNQENILNQKDVFKEKGRDFPTFFILGIFIYFSLIVCVYTTVYESGIDGTKT